MTKLMMITAVLAVLLGEAALLVKGAKPLPSSD